jgi:spore maturation protein CgeB
MGWSPSVRLFEAGACGTPIVSDSWRGLSDLLPPGEAVIMAEGPEDVVRALTLLPEERRAAIGQAARARVLRGHTGEARARELAGIVRDLSPAARSGAAS